MSRKGESITLSLSIEEKKELEKIALQFGYTWGEKPNVSALMKAIASKQLKIYWDDELPKPEIKKKQAQAAIAKIQQGLAELSNSI